MEFLELVIEHWEKIIGGVAAAIIAILQALGLARQRKTDENIESVKASMHDQKQDKKIEELSSQVQGLSQAVTKITSFIDAIQFRQKFASKIKEIGRVAVKSDNIPTEFKSLILEGVNKAAEFFSEIHKEGVKDLTENRVDLIYQEMISILRGLRSGIGNNRNISNEMKDAIKTKVAYPLMDDLRRNLNLFVSNNYNGKTNSVFEQMAINFTSKFISESIKLFHQRYDR